MSKVLDVSTGYHPRPLQAVLHASFKRFNVVVCHRRFGKTHLALNEIIDQALRCPLESPQYAYIAPTYGQAKRVAWDLIKKYVQDIPGIIINESDLRIDIPRPHKKDKIRFMLLGAENPGTLKGIYLDGVILDEFGEQNPQVWTEVVRPALSDRLGWAIFIGTPKGTNHFYEIYQYAKNGSPETGTGKPEDWFAAIYKASETGIIPTTELEAAKAAMPDNEYEQEFECSFSAALVGAYFGKEMEEAESSKRISTLAYDPALPVSTFWDLGVDDTTVIWFVQRLGMREIRLIDYHEESGQGLDYFARVLKERKYVYDEHVLPHDAEVRELGTGKSRVEVLRKLCYGTRVRVLKRQDVADGINAARMILAKCWFDGAKCAKGIAALKNYQRVWDSKNKIYQQRPKHDWASHAADAFRYLAMGIREEMGDPSDTRRYPRQSSSDFSVV